jgi:hypothetical protein
MASNPASVARISRQEVQTSFGSYLQGYQLFQLGYGYAGKSANFAVSLLRLAAGGFEGRDELGRESGSFSAEDRVISAGAGKTLSSEGGDLSLGASVKYIGSRIEHESAGAFAADLGMVAVRQVKALPCAFGLALKNVGSDMRFIEQSDPLPLSLSAGASVRFPAGFVINAFAERPLRSEGVEIGADAGYTLADMLAFRGAFSQAAGTQLGRLSAGMGLKLRDFEFDYAFSPMGEMGNSQRVSATLRFGEGGGSEKAGSKRRLVGWNPSQMVGL